MKVFQFALLLTVFVSVFADSTFDAVMPLPTKLQVSGSAKTISRPLSITISSPDADKVRSSASMWTKIAFPGPSTKGDVTGLKIVLDDGYIVAVDHTTDESYSTFLNGNTIEIHAKNHVGMSRAFASLADVADYSYGSYEATIPSGLLITDSPRYGWRGVLVDTARHYLGPLTVKKILVGMALSKLNVMHWHFEDAQSWSVHMPSQPKLDGGAWVPSALMTDLDVSEVVDFATKLGIAVVPEVDIPGHGAIWGHADPAFTADCGAHMDRNINNIPVSPASSKIIPAIQGVTADLANMFPTKYTHLGGDEVETICYDKDATVAAWLKKQGIRSSQVPEYFVRNVMPTVLQQGRTPVFWEEMFARLTAAEHKQSIFEVWSDRAKLAEIVSTGSNAILASPWYLDKQIPDQPTAYLWIDTWKAMYAQDPTDQIPAAHQANILGGEAAMWAETVDEDTVDGRMWPRILAPAERLWSAQSVTDTDSAEARMNVKRCVLVRAGVHSSPIRPSAPCVVPPSVPVWK
ncbi:Beta-hexosaminidase [Carpediemonas membranifera]|uniref:Beta-hexosaminidase n=1 Tax=Carpediemonas membranifera TaxID=201153 RepID=A0A8J6B292_9EUKA|nr:Beta-hexosaminidase [Carpediemonas membranifera]|eukprot:KAG9396870.1 Beta-hexosaminidase [Carpediemonas membranifera]